MRVSNAPPTVGNRIARRSATACIGGVEVLVAPAPGACLSSGFGPRGSGTHDGIDYHDRPAVDIVAAADGTVLESVYRQKDFGHWIVIDHGGGVFTGYAHLAEKAADLGVGAKVTAGQRLGLMGSSGDAARAVHLHYEVRRGDIGSRKGWWGLTPLDPFAFEESCTPDP